MSMLGIVHDVAVSHVQERTSIYGASVPCRVCILLFFFFFFFFFFFYEVSGDLTMF